MSDLKSYQARFEKLQTRERLLVVLVVIALVYMLWSLLVGNSISTASQQFNRNVTDSAAQLETQRVELQTLALKKALDPDLELRREAEQLAVDIQKLDRELAAMAVGLVPAHDLPLILEEVLVKTGELKLLRLETLPIEELQLTTHTEAEEAGPETGVYRHAVVLTLNGNYFALKNYLEALEQLPWKFYWDALSYQVETYPNADVELRVYTLSTERGAIGG